MSQQNVRTTETPSGFRLHGRKKTAGVLKREKTLVDVLKLSEV